MEFTVPQKWIKKTPLIYYTIVIWHDLNKQADSSQSFPDCDSAIAYLRNLIKYDDLMQSATIRQETVYKKTKDSILSVSGPLIHYEKATGFKI